MATKKAAESTLYHLSPQGFWKKFRKSIYRFVLSKDTVQLALGDAVVVNPEISSGLPIASIHRRPPPASRPEKYNTPATKGMH